MARRNGRRRYFSSRSEDGQDLIEYGLIAPLLLLLLFGIVEFGIVIMSFDTIANAAREGARAAIIPPTSATTVISATHALTTGLDPNRLQISVNGTLPCDGNPISVTVSYSATLMTGFVIQAVGGSDTLPLRTVATMQCEQ